MSDINSGQIHEFKWPHAETHGITANTIIPGWIETPMTERSFGNERFEAAVLKRVPERRWGTGADFGGLAVYLMSDSSAYHTGDQFVIDGGYSRF